MNIQQAKDIPLDTFVERYLGMQPTKVRGHRKWYYSPFRKETDPSFIIDLRNNTWRDWGEAAGRINGIQQHGGTLIDLVGRLEHTDIYGALKHIQQSWGGTPHQISSQPSQPPIQQRKTPRINVISDTTLTNTELLAYAQSRGISQEIATQVFREVETEVHYIDSQGEARTFHNRHLGISTHTGGWAIRSPEHKGAVSPNSFSWISQGSRRLAIFEGVFDYASFLEMRKGKSSPLDADIMILNSTTAHRERALQCLMNKPYKEVWTFMDHDQSGRETEEYLKKGDRAAFRKPYVADLPARLWQKGLIDRGITVKSGNYLYEGYKDLNEYWQQQVHSRALNKRKGLEMN